MPTLANQSLTRRIVLAGALSLGVVGVLKGPEWIKDGQIKENRNHRLEIKYGIQIVELRKMLAPDEFSRALLDKSDTARKTADKWVGNADRHNLWTASGLDSSNAALDSARCYLKKANVFNETVIK